MTDHRFPFTALRNPTLVLFILIFIFLSAGSALKESLTYDEIVDVEEGMSNIVNHEFKEPFNPPFIRMLTAVPLVIGADTIIASPRLADRYFPSRLVTIGLAIALMISVYWATRKYFDDQTAVVAIFLFTFEPNILSHSHYITMDIGVTLFFFLAYIQLLQLMRNVTGRNILFFGIAAGLAMASKISGLIFLIGLLILIIFYKRMWRIISVRHAAKITVLLVVAGLTIWATYFFSTDVIIAQRIDPTRLSSRLMDDAIASQNQFLIRGLTFLSSNPIPLGNYIATIKNHVVRGMMTDDIYFLGGHYSKSKPYFMLIAFLLKTPIPLLILFLTSLILNWRKRRRTSFPYFLLPVAAVIFMSIITRVVPLVRHILPMYPFIIICAATAIRSLSRQTAKLSVGIIMLWYIYGTLINFPHFISYANEFAGPRETRYKYFSDSNIDWGQGLVTLNKYVLGKQPEHVTLSYFGRDDAAAYGFPSNSPWGSYKFEEICSFHDITKRYGDAAPLTIVSVSNWYYCGYYREEVFARERITDVVADAFLIFR